MASTLRYMLNYQGNIYCGFRALDALRSLVDSASLSTTKRPGETKLQWAQRMAAKLNYPRTKLVIWREKRKTNPNKSGYQLALKSHGISKPRKPRPLPTEAHLFRRPAPRPRITPERVEQNEGFASMAQLLTHEG